MFDVANLVACLNGENGPGGTPSLEAPFQFHLKEHWRYPQSLHSLLPWTESFSPHLVVASPSNVMKGADLYPKTTRSNSFQTPRRRLGLSLTASLCLWPDKDKRLYINVLQLKALSLVQFQNQTVLVAMDNSTVVAYINKQGGTLSSEMCVLLSKIMTCAIITRQH